MYNLNVTPITYTYRCTNMYARTHVYTPRQMRHYTLERVPIGHRKRVDVLSDVRHDCFKSVAVRRWRFGSRNPVLLRDSICLLNQLLIILRRREEHFHLEQFYSGFWVAFWISKLVYLLWVNSRVQQRFTLEWVMSAASCGVWWCH